MSQPTEYLRLVGPFNSHTGYSKMVRSVLRCAELAGYRVHAVESDIRVTHTRWGDVLDNRDTFEAHNPIRNKLLMPYEVMEIEDAQRTVIPAEVRSDVPTILIQLPQNLCAWTHYSGAPKLGFTMTESDNLCRLWKHGLRQVHLAVAPSEYVAETFTKAQPDTPTAILPIPVDNRAYSPDEFKAQLPKPPPFLFCAVFTTCERKLWRTLLTAFTEEFCDESDDVGLVVKPSECREVRQLADWCKEKGAWIHVDTEKRTDYTMGALYRACDVYVQPSCEGFGLPYIEAAYCGIPSIALDKGGAVDVVDEETGYLCPSTMEPIIGHMPQFYDRREHNFAVCSVDDLRATLRRAYETERSGQGKGRMAMQKALERYTPEAVAPLLREVVEVAKEAHRQAVIEAEYPTHPKWAVVAGAWGDVFCCVGKIKKMLADKEIPTIGVIYFGRDAKIIGWLGAQPWCREVYALLMEDKKEMALWYGRISQSLPHHGIEAIHELIGKRGIRFGGQIAFTQLCLAAHEEPEYWTGAVLPKEAHEWAKENAPAGKFLILNPFSIASNTFKQHWPHWIEATHWLLQNVNLPVVLVSENPIECPDHPWLVNLTGKSRTMMDVLALAELSAGIVTTGNNLGIYGPICGKEAVVVLAQTCPKGAFYHRWYEHPSISLVEFEEPFADFQRAFEARFPQYLARAVEKDHPSEADFYNVAAQGTF